MPTSQSLDECAAIRFLDNGGRWQTKQLIVLYISCFGLSFQPLSIVFTGFQPKFTCLGGSIYDNTTGEILLDDKCAPVNSTTNRSATCYGGLVYGVNRGESIVSEWNLICGKAYLSETSQTMYTVGMAVGSASVPLLSDRLGRRWSYLTARILLLLAAFGLSLAPNITLFMAQRFLIGALGMGCAVIQFVYTVELTSSRLRPLVTVLGGLSWSLALCVESLVAHLMRGYSWRVLQAVISAPLLTLVLDAIYVKESLMWVYSNKKTDQASILLKAAMEENGVTIDAPSEEDGVEMLTLAEEQAQTDHQLSSNGPNSSAHSKLESSERFLTPADKVSVFDILRSRPTRVTALIVCFTWLVTSLVYYGIFLMSSSLAGDRILNFFLNSVVEVPAYVALYFFMTYFSRQKTLVGLFGLCAVALLMGGIFVATLESDVKYVMMQIVTFIGKFGISASFMLIYAYTSEVFPTNFRTIGLGLGSVCARIGSFVSPFAGALARALPWGPGVVFGGFCLAVTFLLFFVPETKDMALPQTLADAEKLVDKKQKTCWNNNMQL